MKENIKFFLAIFISDCQVQSKHLLNTINSMDSMEEIKKNENNLRLKRLQFQRKIAYGCIQSTSLMLCLSEVSGETILFATTQGA